MGGGTQLVMCPPHPNPLPPRERGKGCYQCLFCRYENLLRKLNRISFKYHWIVLFSNIWAAWKELRTKGPEATDLKPISSPIFL